MRARSDPIRSTGSSTECHAARGTGLAGGPAEPVKASTDRASVSAGASSLGWSATQQSCLRSGCDVGWFPTIAPGPVHAIVPMLSIQRCGAATAAKQAACQARWRRSLRSEARFARHAGVAPVPVSPGRRQRHALDRGEPAASTQDRRGPGMHRCHPSRSISPPVSLKATAGSTWKLLRATNRRGHQSCDPVIQPLPPAGDFAATALAEPAIGVGHRR